MEVMILKQPEPLTAGLGLARLREQVAVVRTIADHADYLAQPENADGFSEQLIEEAARLGCRLLEAAAAMTTSLRGPREGVVSRASNMTVVDLTAPDAPAPAR
jgi:hypothetical protein